MIKKALTGFGKFTAAFMAAVLILTGVGSYTGVKAASEENVQTYP